MYRKGKEGFKGLRIEGTRGRGWRAEGADGRRFRGLREEGTEASGRGYSWLEMEGSEA